VARYFDRVSEAGMDEIEPAEITARIRNALEQYRTALGNTDK